MQLKKVKLIQEVVVRLAPFGEDTEAASQSHCGPDKASLDG